MPATIPPKKELTDLSFPKWVMGGAAADFSKLYSSHLEPPEEFFYMAFLACLGSLIANRVTLNIETKPQPRLYLVVIGNSSEVRKSTSANKTIDIFKEAFPKLFHICFGVGSAEGLQRELKKKNPLLIYFDEFKQFVGKCQGSSSILLPFVNTLFESNRYEGHTKDTSMVLDDSYLSFIACTTKATFESMWTSSFTDIGFNNRLFLIPGTGKRKYSLPRTIPEEAKKKVIQKLKDIYASCNSLLDITEDAQKLYDKWYLKIEDSVHSLRLETYSQRLMILLAVNEQKSEVDVEIVKKVLALVNWQFEVRKELDPVDADNSVAKLEQKIERLLRKHGELTRRQLRQKTNSKKDGIWFFDKAIENLKKEKEVFIFPKGQTQVLRLVED
tara:strand:- start:289 stop:1446 length:1158 start_codon:yes stop_codon:yes gene_type:complete